MLSNPRSEYQARLAARRESVELLERRETLLANLRLLTFTAAPAIVLAAWWTSWTLLWALVIPAAIFPALAIIHDRTIRALDRAKLAVRYYERCLARIDDLWQGKGLPGDDLQLSNHPYAADLDLFGKGSLFELLCTARTRAGERVLATWLLSPATSETIRARQEAVKELRDRLDLREDLALLGSDIERGVLPEVLVKWAEAPRAFDSSRLRYAAAAVAVYNVAALAGWIVAGFGPAPFLAGLIVALLVERFSEGVARRVIESVQEPGRELDVLAHVLERLERETFTHGRLRDVQAALVSGGARASECIARLHRLITWHEARQNVLFLPIALAVMWDIHFAFAFENWRARYGPCVKRWLDALGELEALCSLAAYHYEHPDDVFPEIVDGAALFDGTDVGHPLLPAATCVRNSVRLDGERRVLIVSGSNMSGKSTLLRTVGINVVLALAGGPVRARAMRVSPLAVGATMRVQDSIQTGDSRFYAEIRRLRQLAELAKGPLPLLFLLDEILHGTNSHDRRIGADAILRRFLDAGGIGLVTTHDLALTQAADTFKPHAANVHFEDHIDNGKLVFDYTMRPGVVQKSNALELMRQIGLDV